MGIATRSIGTAAAPLFSAASPDGHAMVMLVLALPISVLFAWLSTRWFGRRAEASVPPAETRNA